MSCKIYYVMFKKNQDLLRHFMNELVGVTTKYKISITYKLS